MLDGDSYKRSSNTKDREIAQISVLEGLGWKLHHIWTMGYARSGAALIAAVERGLKFGRKTGEIMMDEQKNFILRDFTS